MTWESEIAKGATVWRQIGAVRVLRRTVPENRWTGYRAFGPDDDLPIAAFNVCEVPGACKRSGHVGGNYGRVQGSDAPVRTVSDWLAAVAQLVGVAA